MEFPVLSKELRITLRGRETFFTVFFLYSFLAAVVSLAWAIMTENLLFVFWKDWSARLLFYLFIGFGFFGFCFQAGLMASKILVLEREKKSSSLIRIAPLRSWNLVFQKMATPILVEWLFFLGLLPVLSLIFLLGGVGPGEFAYQLMNLAVWINTSILVGLRFSAYAKNTNKARGRTVGTLLLLALFIPFTPDFFYALSQVFELPTIPNRLEDLLGAIFLMISMATTPLETLSPSWMCFSWYLEDMGGVPWMRDEFFFKIQMSQIFPSCPAAISWILHTLLQIYLFKGAVKGWRLTTEEAESATGFDRKGGVRSFLRWVKSGRARHGHFRSSWKVFHDLEDRELFKKGRASKSILMGLYGMLILFFLVFLVMMEERSLTEYGLVLFPVTAGISVLAGIGFGSNSLRRERDRDCATFLLAAPIESRSIFFGKWMYFLTLVLKGMVVGLAATLLWCNLTWPGRRPDQVFTFTVFFFVGSWVPLLTGYAVFFGARSKKGWSIWRFLVPIILFWGVGTLFLLLIELIDSFQFLDWLSEFLEWFLYLCIPWGMLALCALFALLCKRLFPSDGSENTLYRFAFAGIFIGVLLMDVWASTLNQNDQFFFWGNEAVRVGDARFIGRWWVLPLTLAFLLWIFVATRKRKWWLKVLIGKDHSL